MDHMELSASGKGLVHCMDRAEAAAGLKYGDPRVANEMIHSNQLAAEAYVRGAMILDPPSTLYGGDGTEPFLGCFVTGTDSGSSASGHTHGQRVAQPCGIVHPRSSPSARPDKRLRCAATNIAPVT